MRAHHFWTLAAIGLALATSAAAQAPLVVQPGARVRIRWDGARRPLIGPLKELRGDTVVAMDSVSGETIAVPLALVRDVGVSRRAGPGLRWMATLAGVVAGAAAGAWLGPKLPMQDVDEECGDPLDLDCEDVGPTSPEGKAVFGALFGGALFGIVAYCVTSLERWRPVPVGRLGVRATALPAGRFGVGASLDF